MTIQALVGFGSSTFSTGQGSSYVHYGHEPAKPVHKKHNTPRTGILLLGYRALSGWGYLQEILQM
jgi:hypothetical protein